MISYMPPSPQFRELGEIHLASSARAPYLARKAITEWLGSTHAAREIAVLAASELVTNAVKYADAARSVDSLNQITLNLSHDTAVLRLAVTDPGSRCSTPAHIPPQALDPYSERGRGLAMVKSLSRGRWGSYRMPGSGYHHVWCHLDLEPTPAQVDELFYAHA